MHSHNENKNEEKFSSDITQSEFVSLTINNQIEIIEQRVRKISENLSQTKDKKLYVSMPTRIMILLIKTSQIHKATQACKHMLLNCAVQLLKPLVETGTSVLKPHEMAILEAEIVAATTLTEPSKENKSLLLYSSLKKLEKQLRISHIDTDQVKLIEILLALTTVQGPTPLDRANSTFNTYAQLMKRPAETQYKSHEERIIVALINAATIIGMPEEGQKALLCAALDRYVLLTFNENQEYQVTLSLFSIPFAYSYSKMHKLKAADAMKSALENNSSLVTLAKMHPALASKHDLLGKIYHSACQALPNNPELKGKIKTASKLN